MITAILRRCGVTPTTAFKVLKTASLVWLLKDIPFLRGQSAFPANLDVTQLNGQNGVIFSGPQFGDATGSNLIRIGDFNGDGTEDGASGAPLANYNDWTQNGAIDVLYGNSTGLGSSGGFRLVGPTDYSFLGQSGPIGNTVTGGDLNNDRFSELITCVPTIGCWIFQGTDQIGNGQVIDLANPTGNYTFINANGIYLGTSVAYVRNLTGNGYGAALFQGYTTDIPPQSWVFGILGGPRLFQNKTINQFDFTIPSPNGNGNFGLPIVPVKDMDGNGREDFALLENANSDNIYLALTQIPFSTTNMTQSFRFVHIFGTGGNLGSLASGLIDGSNNRALIFGGFSPYKLQMRETLYFLRGGKYLTNGTGTIDLSTLNSTFLVKVPASSQGIGFAANIDVCNFDQDLNDDVFTSSNQINTDYSTTGMGHAYFGHSAIWQGTFFPRTMNFSGTTTNTQLGTSVRCFHNVDQSGFPWVGFGAPYGQGLGTAYFVTGDATPTVTQTPVNITRGQSVVLTTNYLSSKRGKAVDPKIIYTFKKVQGVCFKTILNPNVCTGEGFQCTADDIINNRVIVQHDNTTTAPSWSVDANSQGCASSSSNNAAQVVYKNINYPPTLSCQLTLYQGLPYTITNLDVIVSDPDTSRSQLTVLILKNVLINVIDNHNTTLKNYSVPLQDLGLIRVLPNNTNSVPWLRMSATDGTLKSNEVNCTITYNTQPQITTNSFNFTNLPSGVQGSTMTLTSSNIAAVSASVPDSQIQINIQSNDPSNSLECVDAQNDNQKNNSPQMVQINAQTIQCTQIGTPNLTITASDGTLTSKAVKVNNQNSQQIALPPDPTPTPPSPSPSTSPQTLTDQENKSIFGAGIALGSLAIITTAYLALSNRTKKITNLEARKFGPETQALALEFFKKIRTTTFGYRNRQTTMQYLNALNTLANKMTTIGLESDPANIAQIVNQIQFFAPHISPQTIQTKAENIARSVFHLLGYHLTQITEMKEPDRFTQMQNQINELQETVQQLLNQAS